MLRVSDVLDDFTIVRELGQGGMGQVYEAQQTNPARRVALKVLTSSLAANDDARNRFAGEIEVLARLTHPNIVHIYTSGRAPDGSLYFTMQLVQGITLARYLRPHANNNPATVNERAPNSSEASTVSVPNEPTSTGDYPDPAPLETPGPGCADRFRKTIDIGLGVARALAHAHRKGVLHRDIKPSNLMLDDEGNVLVLDFGLFRVLHPDAENSRPGHLCGTPWYMSPEQARGERLDARSDIYSLGKTLYEIASGGQGPYAVPRSDQEAVLEVVRAGRLIPLRTLVPEIPAGLDYVIGRCLEADPKDRWQNADELIAALEAIRSHDRTAPQPVVPGRWRWALLAGGLGILLVALGLWIGSFFLGKPESPIIPPTPPERRMDGEQAKEKPDPRPKDNRKPPVPVALQALNGERVLAKDIRGPGKEAQLGPVRSLISWQNSDDRPSNRVTFLPLHNDPELRSYEFSVDLGSMQPREPARAEMGVYFGWRAPECRFFMVKIDVLSTPGKVVLGSSLIDDGDKNRAGVCHLLTGFPGTDATIPLTRKKDLYTVRVQVAGDQVTVSVDNDSHAIDLDVAKLRRLTQDPVIRETLYPYGEVGIWVRNNAALFQNARITDLR
jgi:serine/threonine protein kinase